MNPGDPPDLTCQELVELVTDYFEGALTPEDRERFLAHVADCEGCANHVVQVEQTIAVAGALRERDLAPDTRDVLLEAFRDWKRGRDPAAGSV
jgi:anti-sigma factor RsiW